MNAEPDLTKRSHDALENVTLQSALKRATTVFIDKRSEAVIAQPNWEELRERARQIKEHTIQHLDFYLEQLVAKVSALGGKIYWAETGDDVCRYIVELARDRGVKSAVKSKSMTTEEIELNDALEAAGIRPVETDLGEYIIQLAREKPSHITAPAIHKTREQIADLFAEKLQVPRATGIHEITAIARERLRNEFLTAGMGITGANFAIAETGTITLVENEGNIRLSTQVPRIHVAVMGIEKVIPRLEDLAVFLRLLPASGAGQKQTAYVSFLNGPRTRPGCELHLILMDNGRTRMLADEQMRESLYCIRCGACLNVCPVYQKIGGQAYGWIYPGPIGAVISPQLQGLKRAAELPFASSLCGACKDACPVKINLPDLLLGLRAQVKNDQRSAMHPAKVGERIAMRGYSELARHPRWFAAAGGILRRLAAVAADGGNLKSAPAPLDQWTAYRDLPISAEKSFRDWWKENEEQGTSEGQRTTSEVQRSTSEGQRSTSDKELPTVGAINQEPGVLASVCRAIGRHDRVTPLEPFAKRSSNATREEVVARFIEEASAVRAQVFRVQSPEAAARRIADICKQGGVQQVAHSGAALLSALDLPARLAGEGLVIVDAAGFGDERRDDLISRLADCGAGVTAVDYAIAETGTIALSSDERQSLLVSLLPPVHIAILRESQIEATLDAVLDKLATDRIGRAEPCRSANFITGPSRTGDVELTLSIGVHGPKELHLIILAG